MKSTTGVGFCGVEESVSSICRRGFSKWAGMVSRCSCLLYYKSVEDGSPFRDKIIT